MTKTTAYDYGAIEAAVMETGRGRWFLAEFARRRRSADTQALLETIHKLEAAMMAQLIPGAGDALGAELAAMAAALEATEHDMRAVTNDRLADRGSVADGKTAFEDVAGRARDLAFGLAATAEALQGAGATMRQDAAIAGLDGDFARLSEHQWTQDVLSQRIARAMSLIAHLQARIRAGLADDGEARAAGSQARPPAGDTLEPGEAGYFDADSELFAPAGAPPPAPLGRAADDPGNASHLAGLLDDALAGMAGGTGDEPASPTPAAATAAAPPPAPGAEVSGAAPRRVVIVRTVPPCEPSPAAAGAATGEEPRPSANAGIEATAEPGSDAIMQMFTDAAARYGAEPMRPAAELEPFTPGPEERRRIVVIRRNSSADTAIPLEETSEAPGANPPN